MSDTEGFVEFGRENDSVFTMGQRRLCALIAQHLGGQRKLVEACVNMDVLKESKLLKFSLPDVTLREEFYVDSFDLDTANLLSERRFNKSRFLEHYAMYQALGLEATYCVYHTPSHKDSEVFVLADINQLNFRNVGVGGILVNYPPIVSEKLVIPAKQFLKLRYPSPL